jgi:Cd2+/Zn2+-exporting ATPase
MVVAAIGACAIGQWTEAGVLLFLFSLSHGLEGLATERASSAISALAELAPTEATRALEGKEERVAVSALVVGDIVIVRPGERFPIDGVVTEGTSSVDQSPMTGESVPVRKDLGDECFAGTLNGEGLLRLRAIRAAGETMMARMARLVEEGQANRGVAQRLTARFTRIYTPVVLLAVPVVIGGMMLAGHGFNDAFLRGMAVLIGASPCALAISTPSAVLAGIARAARGGVLVKGGAHLETLGSLRCMAFDKTGTLTTGRATVRTIECFEASSRERVLAMAEALDRHSSHPYAYAVRDAARASGTPRLEPTQVTDIPGMGVRAVIDGHACALGSPRIIDGSPLPPAVRERIDALRAGGQAVALVIEDSRVLAAMAFEDLPREGAAAVMAELGRAGIVRIAMLTGDAQAVAARIGAAVGITEIDAGLMPEQKIERVRALRGTGPTAMVGDGINDAPALASADLGIAMGARGSDVALEAADVALMGDDLARLPWAIGLARAARRTITQNVVIAMGVIAVLVPLAAFGGIGLGGAVVLHEGSTVVVAFNALRLLAWDRHAA